MTSAYTDAAGESLAHFVGSSGARARRMRERRRPWAPHRTASSSGAFTLGSLRSVAITADGRARSLQGGDRRYGVHTGTVGAPMPAVVCAASETRKLGGSGDPSRSGQHPHRQSRMRRLNYIGRLLSVFVNRPAVFIVAGMGFRTKKTSSSIPALNQIALYTPFHAFCSPRCSRSTFAARSPFEPCLPVASTAAMRVLASSSGARRSGSSHNQRADVTVAFRISATTGSGRPFLAFARVGRDRVGADRAAVAYGRRCRSSSRRAATCRSGCSWPSAFVNHDYAVAAALIVNLLKSSCPVLAGGTSDSVAGAIR